jgi:glucan endo-1,3-alpha-glucosidase
VFASASATLELSSGSEDPGVFAIGPGVSRLSHAFADGGSMKASLFRHGRLAAQVDAAKAGFRIQSEPEVYNFNVFVAMSD